MEEHIKETIERIQERNARVETDKAWETSFVRIAFVSLVTYACAALFLYVIGEPKYRIAALVPVLGFILSTQSLPFLKAWWIRKVRKG